MTTFPNNLYLAAFCVALLGVGLSLPLWRQFCLRTGHVDDPGHRKIHHRPVPLAGGLAIFSVLSVCLLAGGMYVWWASDHAAAEWLQPGTHELLAYGFSRRWPQLTAIVAGAGGMVWLGWLDDRHDLAPGMKFLGQLIIATVVAAAGVRITLFVPSAAFSYAITILWILTVTNACNFMDNMNGLCAGLGAIGAWCFAWTGASNGQYLVAGIAFLVCGALLGFIPHNFPRAHAFLGDAGSHLVGFLLAILAILPQFYTGDALSPLTVLKPLLVLGVILGDLVWVVILRWRLGRPVYVGDTNHISHRLVRRGLSPTQAVLVIWLTAAVLGWLSLIT